MAKVGKIQFQSLMPRQRRKSRCEVKCDSCAGDVETPETCEAIQYVNIKQKEEHNNVKELGHKRGNLFLYRGLLYSALSSVFGSLGSVIVKYLNDISPGQLSANMFLGMVVFSLPVMIHSREETTGLKRNWHLLLLRGVFGSTNVFLSFVAFKYLPLAEATVIIFSDQVFVSVLAKIFLKEPCGICHSLALILTFIGIVLITKLPVVFDEKITNYKIENIYGAAAAVGCMFFSSLVYIVIRKLTEVHHSVILFHFSWVATVEVTAIALLASKFSVHLCGLDQWLVVALGVSNFLCQIFFTMALKEDNAGPVAIVQSAVNITLGFIWQVWFFNEIPNGYSISGAVLVCACVAIVSVEKWSTSKPENSVVTKNLKPVTL